MPRSEITAMVQRARGMVEYVREKLTDEELKIFLDEIAPLPEPEPLKVAKKTRKKSNKSASKSSRASGMAAAIKDKLQRREPTVGGFADDTDMILCRYQYPKDSPVNSGMPCNQERVNGVHDKSMGYAGYHEFDAGKSSAPPARGRSSTNGAEQSSTRNSEMETADVSNVHHAGG